MATTQPTYKSVFSGKDIDEAIANMRGALYEALISNDFLGGIGKLASAELAKILKARIDLIEDPAHLSLLLQNIVGYNNFTDDNKTKLNYINTKFRGVFPDSNTRDLAMLSELSAYTGNEITLILNDSTNKGISYFAKWDAGFGIWVRISTSGLTNPYPTTVVALAGNVDGIISFDKTLYSAMKCIISVRNSIASVRQIQEVMITSIGADTYISVYGEVGNSSILFTPYTSIAGNLVKLSITTLQDGLTVDCKPIVMI
jgi:hypothetical protein